MLQMFGIPNCETVKKARRYLEAREINYTFHNFKKSPPSLEQLKSWEQQLGDNLVNKRGRTYRQIKDEYQTLDHNQRLELLQQQTSAIKRPLIVLDGSVLSIGFDEASLSKVLLEGNQ